MVSDSHDENDENGVTFALRRIIGEADVYALWKELGECYDPPLWVALPNFEDYIRKVAERAETHALFLGDSFIGAVSLYVNDALEKRAYITQFAIHREYHGKGYGKILLRKSCAIAHMRGMNRIALEVLKDNKPARSLYEKSGFVLIGEKSPTSYLMERSLP